MFVIEDETLFLRVAPETYILCYFGNMTWRRIDEVLCFDEVLIVLPESSETSAVKDVPVTSIFRYNWETEQYDCVWD